MQPLEWPGAVIVDRHYLATGQRAQRGRVSVQQPEDVRDGRGRLDGARLVFRKCPRPPAQQLPGFNLGETQGFPNAPNVLGRQLFWF